MAMALDGIMDLSHKESSLPRETAALNTCLRGAVEPTFMSTTGLANRFEKFVGSLLSQSGVRMEPAGTKGFDFVGVSDKGTRAAIEAKLYPSASISLALLRSAAEAVAYAAGENGIPKSILVTNASVPAGIRQELQSTLGVLVYDYGIISGLAFDHLDLAEEWEQIVGLTRVFRSDYGQESRAANEATSPSNDIDAPPQLRFSRAQLQPPSIKGESLAAQIEKIGCGRPGAREFEKRCIEALEYVFSEDLTSWLPQSASDNGLNRYDLIARISSEEDFWQCLVRDFRARYVIFEFKNYCEQITQKEIYTTEKYLYPAAMRAAAIIISRKGADENALSAARGALRESGKLILNFSVPDLRAMLEKRDRGESGTEVLVQRLDEMLTKIER